MTAAECEIVAEAGIHLRQIIAAMKQALPSATEDWREELHEVYGRLATLPILAEADCA